MARTSTQPVRIPSDLAAELKAKGSSEGRTLPAEMEGRLRASLKRGAWDDVEPKLSDRARALGRIVGFLANELTTYSPVGKRDEYVRIGIARLFERLEAPPKLREAGHEAETMTDYWWLRLRNAHEKTTKDGKVLHPTVEQSALMEIWKDLNATVPDKGRRAGKE